MIRNVCNADVFRNNKNPAIRLKYVTIAVITNASQDKEAIDECVIKNEATLHPGEYMTIYTWRNYRRKKTYTNTQY